MCITQKPFFLGAEHILTSYGYLHNEHTHQDGALAKKHVLPVAESRSHAERSPKRENTDEISQRLLFISRPLVATHSLRDAPSVQPTSRFK